MIFKYIILIILVFTSLNAINLNNDTTKQSLLEDSQIFIDPSSTLTLNDIKNKNFKKTNTNYLRLGYTKSTVWLKFSLKNNTNQIQNRYLTLSTPLMDSIILFTREKDTFTTRIQGENNFHIYPNENILHSAFKIKLKVNETKEFYLKTHTLSSAHYYKLYLKKDSDFIKDEYLYQVIEALFFGAMLVLIIYNIFIYIFTRERAYLYYIFYILFMTLNHSSYTLMFNLLLGKEYAHLDDFLNLYFINISTIFALLFIKEFLNISQNKILTNITYVLIFILTLIMLVNTKEYYLINIAGAFVAISILFSLYLSIYAYVKKTAEAKYILLGWIINIIGIMAISLNEEGFSNPIDIFPYFFEFTACAEAILFSIALASKLNKTKELEQSLSTNKILLKELHHRVKNNMQFIIVLYRLKLARLITPQIDQQLTETESSIQAMSKIHEVLYNKNAQEIKTQDYFNELISKINYTFDKSNIQIKSNISVNLEIEQSIYAGIILNELITNSFKYAFAKGKGNISISLKNVNNKHSLIIQDDGVGFEYKDIGQDTFGLMFVETIVKDELKGDIKFMNENGSKVTIIF